MEIPLPNIRCRTCHDSTNLPVMTLFNTPSETPIYTIGCPNACAEHVRLEMDIPLRQFPVAFQHSLEQPQTGELAHNDPRNFFYVPELAGENECPTT